MHDVPRVFRWRLKLDLQLDLHVANAARREGRREEGLLGKSAPAHTRESDPPARQQQPLGLPHLPLYASRVHVLAREQVCNFKEISISVQ